MSFPNPDNYARDCDCGTAGANTTPPPASLVAEAVTEVTAAIFTNPFLLPNGGSINTSSGVSGLGGSINLSAGGNEDGNNGGSIIATAGEGGGASGGTLNMSGGTSSNTSGGSINTSGGSAEDSVGGSINTSNGGGAIDTRGTGSIQLGVTGIRTTLNGSASGGDKTLTLPNITGTLPIALISTSTALDFGSISTGSFGDLTITLTGAATTDVVFVTCINTAGRGATDGNLIFEAFVSAINTVTVRAHNPTSGTINPASYNFKVAIIKTA